MNTARDHATWQKRAVAQVMRCEALLMFAAGAAAPVWSVELPREHTLFSGLGCGLQSGLGYSHNHLRQRDNREADLLHDGVFE